MKKMLAVLLSLVFIALGFYIFKSNKTNAPKSNQPKFFTKEEILPSDAVVKITSSGFEPKEVNVKKSSRVVWLNQTNNFSWPASDPHPIHNGYPGFDSLEPFKRGEAWAFEFDKVGLWGYHDHLNPAHRAKIIVTE